MQPGRNRRLLVIAGLLGAVFAVTHALTGLFGGVFDPLKARASDRLFSARAAIESLRPTYDDRVVLIAIDDASIAELERFYIGREEYARLVRNLYRAGVVAQFHDLIFAAPETEAGDRALEEATAEAGNVYYGMGLGLSLNSRDPHAATGASAAVVNEQAWHVEVDGPATALPRAGWYFPTYPALATRTKGLGFLDVLPDRDGVYRQAFLLAEGGDGYLPSIALRVAADYLGVKPEDVLVRPGRSITLRNARLPGSTAAADIVIPLTSSACTIVNYLGPWGAMKAYPFSEIYWASDDRFTMEDLREELEGKIAIVTFMATGAEDIGPVPTDPTYPRAAIHATVINSILTDEFMRQLSVPGMVGLVELPLLLLLLVAALRFSTIPFVVTAAGAVVAYLAVVAAAFFWTDLILDPLGPPILLVGSTVVVASYQFHVESQARARLDRELAVAREIQQRTFPKKMPAIAGYDVSGRSDPADETGGDSFDAIPLDDRRMVLLLGDATGHGLGPALSVTQVRSMLRIAMRLVADLDTTLREINDQLAEDLSANRFVTAFLGVLDGGDHRITYHAAGQGPLMHFHAATGEVEWYDSTTMPLGMMEQMASPSSKSITMEPGDILGLMTDGLFEYENTAGEQFGEERVASIVRDHGNQSLEALVASLFDAVREFGRGVPQADDITMLVVRRLPEPPAQED